jgi:replicative DNA helicase
VTTEAEYSEVARLRIPPHAMESEQSVLGSLLADNGCWDSIGDILKANDFYRHEHRLIFEAIGGLLNACKSVDIVTAGEVLRDLGKLDDIGGFGYLNALQQSVPSSRNARRYAENVRDKSLLRQLVALSDECATAAFNPQGKDSREIAGDFAQRYVDLQSTTVRQVPQLAADLMAERVDHWNALHEGTTTPAMSTGLKGIDDALNGGLRTGKVYVLAARPSIGKSSLAQAIGLACAGMGNPSAMLSQEMPAPECMDRATANLGSIDYEAIQTGRLTDMDWGRLSDACDLIKGLPFYIDDQAGLTLRDIRAKALSLRKQGLKVLVIDYLQLCDYEKERGESTNDAVGTLSKGIKRLAKDLDLAVIVLSQLNREVEKRAVPEPLLSDLRDSGAIEQDADVVMFLWECRTFADSRIMGLTFAKNRAGRFKGRLPLEFFGRYQQWADSTADITPSRAKAAESGGFEA